MDLPPTHGRLLVMVIVESISKSLSNGLGEER